MLDEIINYVQSLQRQVEVCDDIASTFSDLDDIHLFNDSYN